MDIKKAIAFVMDKLDESGKKELAALLGEIYDNGYNEGRDDVYNQGYDDGYNDWYKSG